MPPSLHPGSCSLTSVLPDCQKMPTSTVKPVFTESTPSPMLNTRHNQRPVLGSDCPWEWAAQLSAQEKIKRLWKAPWRLVPAMCCRSYRKCWPLWLDGQWSVGCVWTEDMPVLVPLSAMGACKSAESENNVRQMTDLLLNPPTLQAKSSEWSWSEYFLPACPPHPLPPRFNFLNVVINKKNSHILRYLPLILCLSDLNVTLPVFLATFHAKWERQGLLQFTAWQKPTHRKNWWEWNMPHILIITHFGRETVIITERTVKCCSCSSVKGVHDFLLWIEI